MWSILRQYGIPDTIVTIIQNLYKGSRSCVKLNGVCSDWFEVVTGVRQGCILSPLLFAIVIECVMRKSQTNFQGGLEWVDGNKLCDLDYADDIALTETSQMGMQLMTEEVEKISRRVGLRMNAEKCKIMVSNNWEDSTVITAEGTHVEVVEDFCYLGSYQDRRRICSRLTPQSYAKCQMLIFHRSSKTNELYERPTFD